MSTNNQQVTANQPVNATPVTPVKTANGKPTYEELLAQLAELTAANQAGISYKCHAAGEEYTDGQGKTQTGKGVMSMSGLGKFPVSLYESQWRRLIAEVKNGTVEAKLTLFAGKLAKKQ